ncbi:MULTISPECIES: DnaA ATPase domain-containing protein [unclassified Desulfovibrio]|uniref:DnaA ATPase domain-containing protein n=1 Tax=unclassified Desulfovibrio TaxID=2593640 RepID=UPI0021AB697B|nr:MULTISPECIES: DnaA/Hda family protein [unclassified Desulfovibrio]
MENIIFVFLGESCSRALQEGMNDRWFEISENLKKMVDSALFRVWIAPLQACIGDREVSLCAPNAFTANWLKNNLVQALQQAAAPVLGLQPSEVNIRIAVDEARKKIPASEQGAAANASARQACDCPRSPRPEQGLLPLNACFPHTVSRWRYSFEDFVVGPTNNMAVAAAQDVCTCSGCVQTLFVNSASGMGKTHLTQAVGQAISQERSGMRVGYLTAEEFASHFVASLRTNSVEAFKERFRNLDVLLLEDVHFFQGKEKMQDMALAVVKSLQAKNGKVIFTSSFSPRDLQRVDSQLVSHFCSGILAEVGQPTEDMRRRILEKKAKSFQVLLPDNVCTLLASRLVGDVRQLESCLNSLIFKARLLNCGVNLDLAMTVLRQYAKTPSVADISTIIQLVCQSYGLTEQQLASRSRRQNCVLGRNTVYYLARKHTQLTLEEIGEQLNRRHSTVIKGITSLEREISRETPLGRQISSVLRLVERNAGAGA